MNTQISSGVTDILELMGEGFNTSICIIDKDFRILWVNSILENKGFRLTGVKEKFYQQVFDNKKIIDQDDPTYKALKSGEIIDTIKKGSDNEQYKVVALPVKENKGDVQFVVEFTKNLVDYENEEVQKLKDFIFERELKMAELKSRIRDLEEK